MAILVDELVIAYVQQLDEILHDNVKLDEAVGWRGIVSELDWKAQFPKGEVKPEITLTNLIKLGWLDNNGTTDLFKYNKSEAQPSGNRYDNERENFYLTHLHVNEKIALASVYFKAGQDTISTFGQKIKNSVDGQELQINIQIIRKWIASELENNTFFKNPIKLTLSQTFENKFIALNQKKIISTIRLITDLQREMQISIGRYEKKKEQPKEKIKLDFSKRLKFTIDQYTNKNITLEELSNAFKKVAQRIEGVNRHQFHKIIHSCLNKIESAQNGLELKDNQHDITINKSKSLSSSNVQPAMDTESPPAPARSLSTSRIRFFSHSSSEKSESPPPASTLDPLKFNGPK